MAVESGDLTRALLARHRAQRTVDEARAIELRRKVDDVVTQALERGWFERAWLIGSLAWGGFGVRSDVDLVVEGLPPDEAGAAWAALGSGLGVEIDLLRLEALEPAFRQRVLRDGLALGKGPSDVA